MEMRFIPDRVFHSHVSQILLLDFRFRGNDVGERYVSQPFDKVRINRNHSPVLPLRHRGASHSYKLSNKSFHSGFIFENQLNFPRSLPFF